MPNSSVLSGLLYGKAVSALQHTYFRSTSLKSFDTLGKSLSISFLATKTWWQIATDRTTEAPHIGVRPDTNVRLYNCLWIVIS
jgi:hypothetical protein